jgi:hypothetical protein
LFLCIDFRSTKTPAPPPQAGEKFRFGSQQLMFFRDNKRHHLPHIHARYQSDEAAISLEDGSVLDGRIPPKQLKMVQAWIEIHKDELYVDWELVVNGDEPFRIAPLQ